MRKGGRVYQKQQAARRTIRHEPNDMKGPENRFNSKNYYTGVIHIHSGYSHDGHGTISEMSSRLKADGIDFCVLTDHFEDFDENKFQNYITEIEAVNSLRQTIFVPAIEAEFASFHIIFLPVSGYDDIRTIVDRRTLPGEHMLKFLAHPTKNRVSDVSVFLCEHQMDGVEIWNQQTDGNYTPHVHFFRDLMRALPTNTPAVFFGSDIHNIKHQINNLLFVARDGDLTPELVISKLRRREFVSHNRKVAQYLPGNCCVEAINDWFDELESQPQIKPIFILLIKKFLKFFYYLLPRPAQRFVNDFKNAVKNKL